MHQNELILVIKNRRETLKINQDSLAELAGVGLRTLKQLERGKGNPTIKTIQKVSEVLGLEMQLVVKK